MNSIYTLHGKTGVGKTDVLRALEALRYTVIDLEHLAHHKGSIFGASSKKQPSTAYFRSVCENLLNTNNLNMPFFFEWKGKNIGKLKVPNDIITQMNNGTAIILNRSIDERISRLVNSYQKLQVKDLYNSLFLLKKRMEEGNFELALKALDNRQPANFVRAILPYFDKRYETQIQTLKGKKHHINCTGMNAQQMAHALLISIGIL